MLKDMTKMKIDERRVAFYQNGFAAKTLQRLDLSPVEIAVINEAIQTVETATPDVELIAKADAIFKEAMNTNQEHKKTKKAVADAKIAGIKKPQSEWTKPHKLVASKQWAYGLIASAIVYGILNYEAEHYGRYTLEEAQEYCQELGQVVPSTVADFTSSAYTFSKPTLFWLNDGNVMSSILWRVTDAQDGLRYPSICVNTKN